MIERLPTPVGARPARRRARPPEHQGRLARVREDRARTRASGSSATSRSAATSRTTSSRELYDAVVYAVGAQTDRRLGIPGEDLPGSWPATAFVAWYNGHPDFQDLEFDLSHERAVVIGNGNVALDVARMLALTPRGARADRHDGRGDRGDQRARACSEIVVVGRRGPVQAAWTPVEVGELGELAGADILVDPAELELDAASEAELEAAPPTVKRNVEHLREYAARAPDGKPRAIRLRFLASPVAILGDEKVEAIELVRNELVDGRAVRDGRARADRVRDRLPQRRLPRRRAAGRPVRRGLVARCRTRAVASSTRAARRCGALLRGLDQARPDAA